MVYEARCFVPAFPFRTTSAGRNCTYISSAAAAAAAQTGFPGAAATGSFNFEKKPNNKKKGVANLNQVFKKTRTSVRADFYARTYRKQSATISGVSSFGVHVPKTTQNDIYRIILTTYLNFVKFNHGYLDDFK